MATDKGGNAAGYGIAYWRNDCLDSSWGSPEREPMPAPNLGTSGATSIKRLVNGPGILLPHAVANGHAPDVFRRDPNKRFERRVDIFINKAPFT